MGKPSVSWPKIATASLRYRPASFGQRASASEEGVVGKECMSGPGFEFVRFEDVYRRRFAFVRKKLARLGVPAACLEDVTHDVFLLVFRKLGELRDPTRINAWIVEFAVRVASDQRRSLRRRGQLEELPEDLVAPHHADAQFDQQERLKSLRAVLEKMPVILRDVFVLIELQEMSGPEVADTLALNLNTVYSRLRLARIAFNASIDPNVNSSPE